MSAAAVHVPPAPDEAGPPPPVALLDLLVAGWTSRMLIALCRLGVPDALGDDARTARELAAELEIDADALARVLRALEPAGVVRSDGDAFALTPVGACLRRDAPISLQPLAVMLGETWHEESWDRLAEATRTGRPAFELVHEAPFFDHMARHPELATRFDAAMGAFASLAHGAIVDSYDFGDVGVVVDVGGGDGTLLRTLLTRHPHLRGVLLDLPPVVERARERLREHGLGDRLETVAGDFFVSVPSGGDLYLLATVVHDWDDARAIEILARVRAALGPNAKVLIAEQVLPEDGRPFFGKLLDIEMLVLAGGRERTRGEYEALLDAAGLRLERVVPTRTQTSLIEARAA